MAPKDEATIKPVWPSRSDTNGNGQVRCYSLSQKKYIQAYPVDIREALKHEHPTICQFSPEDDKKYSSGEPVNSVQEQVNKASANELKQILDDYKLNVDLTGKEKLADKRKAVLEAITAKDK